MAVKHLLASMLEQNGVSSSWLEIRGVLTNYLQAGEGPAEAIWFPAVGDTAWSFARTLISLAKDLKGVATIKAFDPPGYGNSPLPVGVNMLSFEELKEWSAALVSSTSKPLVLMGNSSGGMIATLSALAQVEQTVRLIYVAWPDWRFGTPPRAQLCPTTLAALRQLISLSWHRPPKLSEKALQSLLEQINTSSYLGHVESFDLDEFVNYIDQFQGPMSFIGGLSDRLVPPSVLQASAAQHNAELFLIENSGHFPHREQPLQLASILTRVIGETLKDHGVG